MVVGRLWVRRRGISKVRVKAFIEQPAASKISEQYPWPSLASPIDADLRVIFCDPL